MSSDDFKHYVIQALESGDLLRWMPWLDVPVRKRMGLPRTPRVLMLGFDTLSDDQSCVVEELFDSGVLEYRELTRNIGEFRLMDAGWQGRRVM